MKDCEITIQIRAPRTSDDQGYMGAGTTYPSGGGNDLADGPLTVSTFARIINDIAAVMEGHTKAYDRDNHPVNAFGTIGSALVGAEGWGGRGIKTGGIENLGTEN